MKKQKEKKNNKKKLIIAILFVLIAGGILIIKNKILDNNSNITQIKTIDNISDYDYTLSNNSTAYQKTLFKELKLILNSKEINDEEYAKKIAQLFTADLFTLNTKLTSSDIGGTQYVYRDFQDDYVSIAQSSLYSSVKSNIYGDRKQELPEVTKVTVDDTTKETFKYGNKVFEEAYAITLHISYKKELGYPEKYKVTIIKNEKNMEIVKASEN
ncbi:MAG: hypothetical protein PUD59_05420 [bacterium]|nr:hypothetical protein [bacterium]